jgi:hypothetical protein
VAGDIKLKAGTPQTLEASGASVSTTAVGTANDADLDNTATLAFSYDFELNGGFGSSVTAGEDLDLYLVPKLDGTNAADADTSTPLFQPDHYAGTFITPTTGTAARRMTIGGVDVGPYKYTAYVHNKSGQTLSATWVLKAFPVLDQFT